MAIDPKGLAARLGIEHRERHEPTEADGWPVTDVRVAFFKTGDPEYSFVALDGELIPKGPPIEEFREELAKNGGVVKLPGGISHPVCIPDDVRDGEGFRVSVAFTRMKPAR